MINGDARGGAQSGLTSHQGGAQENSTQVTENAVRFTEKLKTEIRNTYSMKANILGPTACAMAMQIDLLTEQQNKAKGHGHPSHGGAIIPPAIRKERQLWARHLSRCSCSMAKVSAIHVHLIIFDLLTNRWATRGMPQHRQCRRWREVQAEHLLRNAGNWYLDWTNHVSGQRAR